MPEIVEHAWQLAAGHILGDCFLALLAALGIFRVFAPLRDASKSFYELFQARKWLRRVLNVGVRNFYPSRESYSRDRSQPFIEYLQSANNSLRYIGHWLAFTIDQNNTLDTLCDIANSGRKVTLILLSPELPEAVLSAYARYLGEDGSELHAEITNTWKKVQKAEETLSAKGRECLDLRRHTEFIPYSAFWFDRGHDGQHILIDMKLYGASRKDAYGIEFEQASRASAACPSLFQRYADSLSLLENRSI